MLTGADGLQHIWEGDEINGLCRLDPTGATVTRDPNFDRGVVAGSCGLAGGLPWATVAARSWGRHCPAETVRWDNDG